MSGARVSKWLRGYCGASPSGNYVRVLIEREYGSARVEVYLSHTEARQLRDSIDQILTTTATASTRSRQATPEVGSGAVR